MFDDEDFKDDQQILSHRQPSVTAVLDDECGPKRRTIQQSSGKRRKRKDNTPHILPHISNTTRPVESGLNSPSQMEHTFGDQDLSLGIEEGEIPMDFKDLAVVNIGIKKSVDENREMVQMPSMANESNIPWLNSKGDISLSTDSMFNLHDEEVKQLLDQSSDKKGKFLQVPTSCNQSTVVEEIPEVAQLIAFITQIETLWSTLTQGEFSSLLTLQSEAAMGNKKMNNSPDKRNKNIKFPAELSSKLTHQITQITVFYQLNQSKEGFRMPTRKVSNLARIAKQMVVQDKINIPRQTRS